MKQETKILIAGAVGCNLIPLFAKINLSETVMLVEDYPKEDVEFKPVAPFLLAEIKTLKPIEERGVIPDKYKKKHYKK
jgi:hypothetical protein